ncbi:alpha/beta hydrolase [Kutzneria viridogrisea]|uniref:AB hydrolase-1 domain-containing protein n=2 Tax=Kutzneria TaxID=43356 RepID=W5W3X3_9PSEU|nr:alpha/beta hydrolase [Kutzneria albida]AHH95547.1 hypothetical protein KALB_2178 [Kutzneria albida DSM 43870]MBA8927091.1 pimeloyl-ACP methyl ester carboxylesterase [Kutzneria viridogrisea]
MPVVETRNGPVEHFFIDGDPDLAPLVFLHGGLGCTASWGRFPSLLAAETGRRALLFSRIGSGYSGPATRPKTARYVHEEGQEALPELLDLLDVRRPVFVGHSDGGSMGLLYAAIRPVEAVVALGPHLYFEEQNRLGILAAQQSYADGPLARKMGLVHRDPKSVFDRWSQVWLSEEFSRWNIEADVAAVTDPVLMIQGDRDEYGSLDQLDALERSVSGPVKRVVPEGVDHYPHLVCPDLVIEQTCVFLAEHANRTQKAEELS